MQMEHYFTLLQNRMADHWDAPALCNYQGESFRYSDVAVNVARLHLLFETSGVRKAQHIAVCAKNSARWAVSFLASNTYETVTVSILSDFTPASIASLVNHSDSIVLFTDPEIWEKLDKNEMPALRAAISVKDFSVLYNPDGEFEKAAANLDEAFSRKYPDGFSASDIHYPTDNLKELGVINYTSGTTSSPKGVMLRYECINTNVIFGQTHLPTYLGETVVSMLPLAHMYGLMYEFLYPICGGASITFLGKTPSPSVLLAAMQEVKPYVMSTVPLVIEKIFKSSILPQLKKFPVSMLVRIPGVNNLIFKKIRKVVMSALGGNIREIILGGAALNPTVEYWVRKIGLPYTLGYGMTETAPLITYEPWRTFIPKSCGKAVERCEIRIDSEDPYKVVGEIQVRGMNVMSGYFKNEAATKAVFTEDGWMCTGDLGVLDKDNNLYIRGRSKNLILSSNGQNIYPEEIEAALNARPFVLESVVVDRATKLVGLVYLDAKALKKAGIEGDAVSEMLEQMKTLVNKDMPVYSKISKMEQVEQPFEKTPKMSIKRFLYQ